MNTRERELIYNFIQFLQQEAPETVPKFLELLNSGGDKVEATRPKSQK